MTGDKGLALPPMDGDAPLDGRPPLRGSGHSGYAPDPVPGSGHSASVPDAGHTPGPLCVADGSMDCPDDNLPPWEVHVPLGRTTAYCRRREDALLYAAAPELLEALELMRDDLLQRAEIDRDGSRIVDLSSSRWIKVNAAIAKARGQS